MQPMGIQHIMPKFHACRQTQRPRLGCYFIFLIIILSEGYKTFMGPQVITKVSDFFNLIFYLHCKNIYGGKLIVSNR